MTVSTTSSTQTFSGGQSTLTFSFRALVNYPQYIKLLVRNTTTGEETNLTYSSQYTVSINTSGIGGTVTVSPTYSTGYNYIVYRDTSAVQGSDYDDYNAFPADTVEEDFDRAILKMQEMEGEIDDTSNKIKAWVNFDGTASNPITPNAFYATSASVLKNSTGDYTITWSPTMSSINYGVLLSGGGTTNFLCAKIKDGTTQSTSKITINTLNTSFAAIDVKYITVAALIN